MGRTSSVLVCLALVAACSGRGSKGSGADGGAAAGGATPGNGGTGGINTGGAAAGAPGTGGVSLGGSGGTNTGGAATASGGAAAGGAGPGTGGSPPTPDGGGAGGAPDSGAASPRLDQLIDDGWRFVKMDVANAQVPSFDDAAWTSIVLPHTWNNMDGQDGGSYYRGVGWYRRHWTVPSSYAGRNIYLQFDGAFLVTEVYLNGKLLGQHGGGFATFRFDATSAVSVGADNVIAVKVSNAVNPSVPPLEGDFTMFGGLYREVHVVVTDRMHIDVEDFGSSGVYLAPAGITTAAATVGATVKLKNSDTVSRTVDVVVTILDRNNQVAATAMVAKTLAAGASDSAKVTSMVSVPHPWNGLADPYLYQARVELREEGQTRDQVTQPLGFRTFAVDPATGFSLNGAYADLRGVNRHQDRLNKGWAIGPADQDNDIALLKELGANAVRLAHYQHGQYFLDLCDRHGFVVWTELAMVNQITNSPAFTASARQQITELIRQNFNHPSIFFWGIENEVIDNMTDPNPLIAELDTLARTEDPSRLTTVAANLGDDNAINWHTDVTGFNKYYGWYYGAIGDIGGWADGIHAKYATRRIAVSEYGAGAGLKNHTLPPTPATDPQAGHSEEYQALFHEGAWKAMQARRFLWGKFIWQMFDSASDGRDETAKGADGRGINDKGLVAFDHTTRKDAFYWYRANWSTAPFVYLTSRRFSKRTTAATSIKVYSNLSSVDVKLNGVSLGVKTSTDHIFLWDKVTLAAGANHVEAAGASAGVTYSDTVDWSL